MNANTTNGDIKKHTKHKILKKAIHEIDAINMCVHVYNFVEIFQL